MVVQFYNKGALTKAGECIYSGYSIKLILVGFYNQESHKHRNKNSYFKTAIIN